MTLASAEALIPAESGDDTDAVAPAPGLRRLLRSGQVRLGLALVAIMIALAEFGRFFAPDDPSMSVSTPFAGPSGKTWLGTDELGRDVLSRVLVGGESLAWMAPAAAVASVLLGGLLGVLGAYYGGAVDLVLGRVTDVLLAFPALLFTLLFVSVIGPKRWLLVVLVTIGMLPGVARVIRGAAIPIVKRDYVRWARTVGVPDRRVLTRDLLPNLFSPLMVEFGMRLMWSIGVIASISFVGYGIQPPTADWGLMVSENRTGLQAQPWAVIAPVLCVLLFTVGGNLIAEGAARVIARTEGKD